MKNKLSFFILILFFSSNVHSQEEKSPSLKGFSIGFTSNLEAFEDNRFTFRRRKQLGFNCNVQYFWGNQRQQQTLELSFGKNFIFNRNELVSFQNLRPDFIYSYERKSGDLRIGGYTNIGTLLSFPKPNWRGNNSISYTMWSSLGISAQYHKPFTAKRNHTIFTRIRIPIVNYVIRPSYGLPYPEQFLQEDTFDFQRKGMGKHIFTSGKFSFLNRFQNILFELGITSTIFKNNHQVGVSYLFDYLQYDEEKDLLHIRNGLKLFTLFNL